MLMCRGTVAAIRWPGSMQARNSGCATTDQRLRSTTAPSASTLYEERKQERFDNRSCIETSVVETGKSRGTVHAIHSAHGSRWPERRRSKSNSPPGTRRLSQAARYAQLSPKHKQSVVDRIAVTLTESKIAGCRRSDHTKHAPALQWQERSEVK